MPRRSSLGPESSSSSQQQQQQQSVAEGEGAENEVAPLIQKNPSGGPSRGSGVEAGHGSLEPELRGSFEASPETGAKVHAAPDATVLTTFLNITCNIIGVGVLAIPTAMDNASLGFGIILIVLFQFFSSFSSYVLSVGCEYTQFYSQSQLLCHCLAGYADPEYWREIGHVSNTKSDSVPPTVHVGKSGASTKNGDLLYGDVADKLLAGDEQNPKDKQPQQQDQPQQQHQQQQHLAKKTSSPGSSKPSASRRHQLQDDSRSSSSNGGSNNNVNVNNNSNASSSQQEEQLQAPYAAFTSSTASAASKAEMDSAEDSALHSQRRVNLVLDLLLGVTYFGYTIAYARVVADSMKNVSGDIGLPEFFRTRVCWLIIAGFVFLILSMRRVFQEMMITSVIGITTIFFVILCLVVRLADPDDVQPERFAPSIRYWVIDSNFLNAFATLSSAFGYQVNHPSFYQEMRDRNPGEMQKPVMSSMTLVSLTYILTGTVGYLTFGQHIQDKKIGGDVVNGFGNDDILINVARVGLFVHFVCVFPLIVCAVRQCIHRACLRTLGNNERADDPDEVFKVPFTIVAIEVSLIVIASVVLAGIVPGIDIVINFVGCLGGTFALMILPGIVGMYIFPEIGARIESKDETLTPIVASKDYNNFIGCAKTNFSYTTLYWLSAIVLVIGAASTIGGFIVIFNGM